MIINYFLIQNNMASSQKEYSKEKLFWQIYTPTFIVYKILDEVWYSSKKILWKTILDPACWDGRFLVEIVKRVLKYSPKKDLEKNLLQVYGWDIDEIAIQECIKNLDNLIKDYSIKIKWNIEIKNSLHEIEKKDKKFDFIVWNPPYIRIQHLEIWERKYIQNYFKFCKMWSTDIFIAFFELAKNLLNKDWICSFISPNSYFKSETWKFLRDFLAQNHIISLYDFWWIQVFETVTTYTCITTFSNNYYNDFWYFKAHKLEEFQWEKKKFYILEWVNFWQLWINYIPQKIWKKLWDICKIFVWLATLCDKAYIFDFVQENDNYIFLDSKFSGIIQIEKEILKPIIKVSRNKKQFILFPYEKINWKHKIIDEEILKYEFPFAYKYLLWIKHILEKRSNGKSEKIKWYEFWRNQALDTSFWKKIVFSTMNEKPNFILVEDENSTFYSWYAIKYDWDYNELLKQLNSKEMENFINISGKDLRWWWKSYNKKIVEEFIIN